MLRKIKDWVFAFKQKSLPIVDNPLNHKVVDVKECVRDTQTKKRVAAAFRQQKHEMGLRAMKAHSCSDPITCTILHCFKYVPDKTVGKSVVVSVDSVRQDMKRRTIKKPKLEIYE